jgi:hypothetical protein
MVGDYGMIFANINGGVTAAEDQNEIIPSEFFLEQNYPNPVNSFTTIRYRLPKSSFITLDLYNLLGEKIASLVREFKPAGVHTAKFDFENSISGNKRILSSGVYFYRLSSDFGVLVKSMAYVK